ncbi:signal peptidase I [Saccharothrix sp. 6-C]|uniref:Signal peptidase I n=1 Tax=Saccharothrix texasensis TaxID=103734 RepID=A0A3N1HDY0_9PSEU|nr:MULTISPECIES: signal peptidase I [Saccharothrix]QQQ75193.1 signal peptidase I [Saccharothrix sp. 6-C]ROP40697.1 signal peptidase I [Saccharothrix texasensis]
MADPVHRSADEDGQDPAVESSTDSTAGGKSKKDKKKPPLWRELLVLGATALVLTILIQTFLARVYVIPSQSMEQTLHGCPGCNNDRVLVDKLVYDFTDIEPGEVVVFRGPETWGNNDFNSGRSDNPIVAGIQSVASLVGLAPPDERDFVKRVIAVGGQTVECCDDQHRVKVDGKPLDEPYIYWQPGTSPENHDPFEPVKVPEGHLWVMGDNRTNSTDSRKQGGGGLAGTVPEDNVIGKARVIVLPPSRWQGIGDHNPQALALGAPAWQGAIPAGAGLAAAWPLVFFGRKVRRRLTRATQP